MVNAVNREVDWRQVNAMYSHVAMVASNPMVTKLVRIFILKHYQLKVLCLPQNNIYVFT